MVEMNCQLDWLVHEAKLNADKLPKTFIFCNTLTDIASIVNVLLLKLGSHAYIHVGSNDRNDFILGIFHSASWRKYKEKLLNEFKCYLLRKESLWLAVRWVWEWTSRYVVNWGPARTLFDQLQEAGRDGKLYHVIIIYHGNQLSHCKIITL
jgi:hypothetical protein